MSLLNNILGGLRALISKQRRTDELDEELRAYLDAAIQDKQRKGLSYADAVRASRVEMGSIEAVKDEVRAAGWEWAAETLWMDIRYGARQLARSPAFSAVAIVTLALGIGANTAVFTLLHGVLLRQLAVDEPEKLYRIGEGEFYCCEWGGLQDSWGTFDYTFYEHLRDTNTAFGRVAAFSGNTPSFTVRRAGPNGTPHTVNGEYVSGNYFETMGVRPSAGRLLSPADDRPDAPAAVVIGRRMWERLYGSDPSIAGSTVLVNDVPVVVTGVAPRDFSGARLTSDPPEMWIPLNQQPAFDGERALLRSPGMAWLYLFGRLEPAVRPAQAEQQLSAMLQGYLRSRGRRDDDRHKIAGQRIRVTPGGAGVSSFRGNSRSGLYVLMSASVLVLLIACGNLANLLLARSASRRQQIALQLSLGATRLRLISSAITESVLLSTIGGAAGLIVAYAGTKAILAIVFRGAPFVPLSASPSLPVLGFAVALSIATGVVFGALPAWLTTLAAPSDGLRGSSRSVTGRSMRPQKALIVAQATLSMVLLAVAGLVTQSLRNLETADLGFETRGKLLARISFRAAGYQPEQLPGLYRELQRRLEQIPGVRSSALSLNSPQELCCVNVNIAVAGRSALWIQDVNVVFGRVSPRYFETIGTPVLRGRTFTEHDTEPRRQVAVVDEAFARKFFPGEDPLGQRFGLTLPGHANDYEIVGVVKNTVYRSPASVPSPMYFLPFSRPAQFAEAGYRRLDTGTLYAQSIHLSVAGHPEAYEARLRQALATLNPNLAPVSVKPYTERVALQYNQQRLIARLSAMFGLLALLLASVGLYGVTAYNVTRRTSEIGIRMALGAPRGDVMRMVVRGALLQVLAGLCIGLPLAVLCGRYLSSQLYGVPGADPALLGGAAAVLILCATAAAAAPARRAASIEPVQALRAE